MIPRLLWIIEINYWIIWIIDRFFKNHRITPQLRILGSRHTPSPSKYSFQKAWRGCETRSPRVIRSRRKRERCPVVEQRDPFWMEQPTFNVIHSMHSGVCVEWLGATSLIQIRRRWNRCLWPPALYLSRDLSLPTTSLVSTYYCSIDGKSGTNG